jgi:hypothetical protein
MSRSALHDSTILFPFLRNRDWLIHNKFNGACQRKERKFPGQPGHPHAILSESRRHSYTIQCISQINNNHIVDDQWLLYEITFQFHSSAHTDDDHSGGGQGMKTVNRNGKLKLVATVHLPEWRPTLWNIKDFQPGCG